MRNRTCYVCVLPLTGEDPGGQPAVHVGCAIHFLHRREETPEAPVSNCSICGWWLPLPYVTDLAEIGDPVTMRRHCADCQEWLVEGNWLRPGAAPPTK